MTDLESLLIEARECRICEASLPFPPRPILQVSASARLLVIGQAPGIRVHESGIPWNDASGDGLREWLQVSRATFYEPGLIGIVPMGFCYPGKGKSGDAPPRPECAPLWHTRILTQLPSVRLTLLIGNYSQACYLPDNRRQNLTETVLGFADWLPHYFPLPHPSPRNRFWMTKNPWFQEVVIPELRRLTANALAE